MLSLDAPTVATTWMAWVANISGIHLPRADLLAMFLAVWLLYVADRLLDARPLAISSQAAGLEERHHFHHAYRTQFLGAALCAMVPLSWLVHTLHERELRLFVVLSCLLAGWLLVVHVRPSTTPQKAHELPKELAVGAFFSAAVFVPTVARRPELWPSLWPFSAAFALLCTLNCLLLFSWEHPDTSAPAHYTTRWGSRHTVLFGLVTCAASTLAGLPARHELLPAQSLETSLALVLSCISLGLLHVYRHRFASTTLRATSDLALLTPIPIYLASHLSHLHG